VDIIFESTRFHGECNDQRQLIKRHGAEQAKRITLRLTALRAARCLEDMRHAPGRCHELRGDRAGVLSLDLTHPYRLLFTPAHNPLPLKPDGGLDWAAVTAVTIIGVEDTHD